MHTYGKQLRKKASQEYPPQSNFSMVSKTQEPHNPIAQHHIQTQRVNQVIKDMPRAYCMRISRKWIKDLYFLVEFSYNTSHQRSIRMAPIKALYEQECLTSLKWTNPMIRVQASKEMLDDV